MTSPIRILHVVSKMDRAGIETWLMNILRYCDREHFKMDFLVNTQEPGHYDEEIRHLGGRVIPCLRPERPMLYARNFKKIIKKKGPYDIIHIHFRHYSGWVLLLAYRSGIPIRIAHSHSDLSFLYAHCNLIRRMYFEIATRLIEKYATAGLACSNGAGRSFYDRFRSDGFNWRIHYCGIDLSHFQSNNHRNQIRSELGIPAETFVVGHVGRFELEKNHGFLLNIIAEIVKTDPSIYFLLVGDGPLRNEIQSRAKKMKVQEKIIFTGFSSDVPRLMLSAMDLFLFPSLFEGLGLVLVEAQASGLPCIYSDIIPEEADIVKGLIRRISLSSPPSYWAETILSIASGSHSLDITRSEALETVESSQFNILSSVKELETFYENELHST